MKILSLETGNLKLDGGAMFGVVPKVLWNKVYPADENNLVNLSMRSLLVDTGHRRIIIDTGMGEKQDEKFLSHYYLNGDTTLVGSLKEAGYSPEDITDVLFTHLHFDHCGGGVRYNDNGEAVLTFPNATYLVSAAQWEAATKPNAREKASFLPENINPIKESGRLKFLNNNDKIGEHVTVRLFDGHTTGQAIPFIQKNGDTLVYIGDVVPSVANIPLSWITAYDMQPLVALEEKKAFLEEAFENQYVLFFEHDIYHECCTLKKTEKGIRPDKTFALRDWV